LWIGFSLLWFVSCASILDLNDENFNSEILNHPYTIVLFYTPECEQSKLFIESEFDTIVAAFDSSKYAFGKVNVAEGNLGSLHTIIDMPTIKLYRKALNGLLYDGERSADKLINWIKKKTVSPSTELNSQAEIDDFITKPGNKMVAKVYEGGKSLRNWMRAAGSEELEKWQLGHVLLQDQTDNEVITMYNEEDDSPIVFNDEILKTKILKWVQGASSIASELTENLWTECQESLTPLLMVVTNIEDTNVINLARKIGKSYKGKLVATYSDNLDMAKNFGISGNVIPTAVLVQWPDKVTAFNEDSEQFTWEALDNFVKLTLEGQYTGYLRSEPIPETNDGPVKVIVTKSLEEIITNPHTNVFIKFYAPWCGHCKTIAPIWQELGEKFAGNEKVVIGEIDAIANALPYKFASSVQGFPTFILYTTQNKEGILYQGERTVDDFTQFVNSNLQPQEETKTDL